MKERMLTVLVPIKDSDATVVTSLPAVTPDNINVIYKHEGVYKRLWLNPATNQYEYHEVIDREFPYLGRPLEIFNFTYDATRMGTAPSISAQAVMWFADKDENGNDVTLEGLWSQEVHVSFNGENYYLKLIPTSTKSNEDARYKYDLDFVSERIVLETVYLYDVVTPFVTERPISESSEFGFYGDISELAKRINSSLLRSGLATLQLQDGVSESDILTYEEWNQIGLGTYDGDKPIRKYIGGQGASPYRYFYPYYGGNYSAYLRGEIYATEDGEFVMHGYQCIIGKDKKGELSASEEKLITFDKNTIHEALQKFQDTFGLQYYITRKLDSNGAFTGDTLIMVADCEHDFADINEQGTDYVRDEDNIPTTENPFDYGVDDELLSKEKTNTTDKIITRITGVGGEENIPWYYPNPTSDGWIRPMYKTNGEEQDVNVDYPQTEDASDAVRYEKYLKNNIGNVFSFGKMLMSVKEWMTEDSYSTYKTEVDESHATLCYTFTLTDECEIRVSPFECSWHDTSITYHLFKDNVDITGHGNAFLKNGGSGTLAAGEYNLIFSLQFNNGGPTLVEDVQYYYYPETSFVLHLSDTFPSWTMAALMLLPMFAALPLTELFSNGHSYTLPAFLSTNPNLKLKRTTSGKTQGWYNGNTRVRASQMIFGEPNKSYYAFLGGSGVKHVGEDDVYRLDYRVSKQEHIYRAITDTYDLGDFTDSVNFIFNYIWGGTRNVDYKPNVIEECDVSVSDFIKEYITYFLGGYLTDGWYKDGKKVLLEDFGISNESELTPQADVFDTIEFCRAKYVTPQPNLMPEVYIKTDGERRFYNAVNYPLSGGTPDPMIGEVESEGQIVNPIYYKEGVDTHYDFENEYMANMPKEHIESFDDIKPTIKGQTNYIHVATRPDDWVVNYRNYYRKTANGEYVPNTSPVWSVTSIFILGRIDVIEEFAYDETDNDEIWENNENGNIAGEYKHPYFFAKLRPMGFNIFDLALQDDMVISMTTGHCGACNFKIGVDENTKKNPVQIWEYDVYEGSDYSTKEFKHSAGELRRYEDVSNLYYDTTPDDSSGYIHVDSKSTGREGFMVSNKSLTPVTRFSRETYSAYKVINGEVGALKQEGKTHFEGDVKTNGRFIESQQDTSENYVWVALMKDTDTYGTIMPSARPDYADHVYDVFIRPQSISDVHIETNQEQEIVASTNAEDEEKADKFVIINIRLPQVYLRRAERELSRKIVEYMYDNNYQKFNFSIKFSRIFLAQNPSIDADLNENSVLYVSFNNRTYRQYVKHFTYRMTKDASLPEISVDMNKELSVSHTQVERESAARLQSEANSMRRLRAAILRTETRIGRQTIGRNEDAIVGGNLVSRDAVTSFGELQTARLNTSDALFDTQLDLDLNHYKRTDFEIDEAGRNLRIGESRLRSAYVSDGVIRRDVWSDTDEEYQEDEMYRFVPAKQSVLNSFISAVNTFNSTVVNRIMSIRYTMEDRLGLIQNGRCSSSSLDRSESVYDLKDSANTAFWKNGDGENVSTSGTCPSPFIVTWTEFNQNN